MSEPHTTLPDALRTLVAGLDPDAATARVALVRELLAVGHSIDELLAAHAADRLALLPVADALREDGTRRLDDVAAEYGVSPEDLAAVRQALGLPVTRTDAVYGQALERHARRLRETLDAGLSREALISFNYVIGAATASIAAGARDATRTLLAHLDPNGSEFTRAIRTGQLAESLAPLLTDVVSVALGEHLRETARREVTASLVSNDDADSVAEVTIVFADLVGFTALGDRLSPDRLGEVAVRLAHLAHESLVGDTEVVKTLGDGVMLGARTTLDAMVTARALITSVTAAGLPPLRVGVAHGPAFARAGDWYGSVVNRASRLCAVADPGRLVADDTVRARTELPDVQWRDLGAVEVRGLRDPVRCWAVDVG